MTTSLPVPSVLLRAGAVAALCTFGAFATAGAADKPKAKSPVHAAKKTAAKPVDVAPPEASAEQQQAAEEVFYGAYQCEFNQTVDVEKSNRHASYVDVKSGKSAWLMKPVRSSTGAIRLEDIKGETLLVQIQSKSMLLNVKSGQRLVDACISPRQRELTAATQQAEANGQAAAPKLLAGPDASAEPARRTARTKAE
jgi:hypothetical protein